MGACSKRDELRHDDLVIPQSCDTTTQWPIVDGNGDPIPSWTGWSAQAQARPQVNSDTVLYEWSTAIGNIDLVIEQDEDGPVSGLNFTTPGDDSKTWTWRNAVFDVELTNPFGLVFRISSGRITVSPAVTR